MTHDKESSNEKERPRSKPISPSRNPRPQVKRIIYSESLITLIIASNTRRQEDYGDKLPEPVNRDVAHSAIYKTLPVRISPSSDHTLGITFACTSSNEEAILLSTNDFLHSDIYRTLGFQIFPAVVLPVFNSLNPQ
jgi:hypothetical protein